ncbi:unnamed protein product [Caenorhabditis brenneri]
MASSGDKMDKQGQKKEVESRNDQNTSEGTTGDDHPPSRSRSSSASRGSRSSRKVHPGVVTSRNQSESKSRSRSRDNSQSSEIPDDPLPSGPSTSGGSSLGPWAPAELLQTRVVYTDTPRYEETTSPSDSSGPDTGRTVINMGSPRPGTADTVIHMEPMDTTSTGSETPRNEQQPIPSHEEQGGGNEEKMEGTTSTVQFQEVPPTENPAVSPSRRNPFAGPQGRQPERKDSESTIHLRPAPPEEDPHKCC